MLRIMTRVVQYSAVCAIIKFIVFILKLKMDLQQLRLFVSLARNLHFGNASLENHMSPSAASRSIQRLEELVGHKLFIRDNRSVQLTDQGEIFFRYASDVLARWELLNQELGQTEGELSGKLTVFASVTASMSILPNVLSKFRADYPLIHLQLETGNAANAIQKLYEGCDVVVTALPDHLDEKLIKKAILSIPIETVAPLVGLEAEAMRKNKIDWSSVPLVLPTAGQSRESVDKWFATEGLKANIYTEVAGNEAILSLVALGCGVGFVPRLVINESPLKDRVQIIESGPALADFQVGFCTRKNSLASSDIIRAFWDSI